MGLGLATGWFLTFKPCRGGGLSSNPQGFAQGIGTQNAAFTSSAEKNNGKWRIVVVFLAVAILALLLVWVCIWCKNVSECGNSEEMNDSFNKFANYLLYGEDKNDAVTISYDENKDIYFYRMLELGSDAEPYLTRLFELYQHFYEALPSSISDDDYYGNVFEQYGNKLRFLMVFYKNGMLTRPMLMEYFVRDGEMGANEYVDNFYAAYEGIPDIYSVSYYNEGVSWGRNTLRLLAYYDSAGCIVGQVIDYECASGSDTVDTDAIYANISSSYDAMTIVLDGSKNDMYDSLFDLVAAVNVEEDND